MKYDVVKDIEFIKEALGLSENQFSSYTGIPRSSLNNWYKNNNSISKQLLEKVYSFAYDNNLRINSFKQQMFNDAKKKNEVILFHGAKQELKGELSLEFAKDNNDFGKGVYLGENFIQSASYICSYEDGSVYIYKYNKDNNLKVLEYDVDIDWMLTIAYYRKRLNKYIDNKRIVKLVNKVEEADLVIAPIADNNMYQIIEEFINGNITDKQCISSLSATDLGKQYVFLNKKALSNLSKIHHCYLCRKEKDDYRINRNQSSDIGIQKVKYVTREYAGKGKYIDEILK